MGKKNKGISKIVDELAKIEWRLVAVNGNSTGYMVSSTGKIMNTRTGKILDPMVSRKGYHQICMNCNGVYTNPMVHRVVAQAFIPNPENKPQVNHINGDKSDNRVENLEWVTCQENIDHAWATGLHKPRYGDDANASKYTEKQVHEVCKLLEQNKLLNTEIAKITGVDVYVISKIKCRNCWMHISDQYKIPIPEANKTGQDAPASKYTDEQIHQVCKMIAEGNISNVDIAKATGVGIDMVHRIKFGKNWNHIASQYGIKKYEKKVA